MKRYVAALLWLAAACGSQAGIRITAPDNYEVGEEATVAIDAPGADPDSPVNAEIVIVRPDGTKLRQSTKLVHAKSRVKIGDGPTFMQTGRYRVELLDEGKPLAPPVDIAVNVDHLNDLLQETIVEYKARLRYARPRAAGPMHWMQYGGIYEHPWKDNHDIEVTIEEPQEAFGRAWSDYEEQGTLQVIQNNYVRLREGTDTTTAAWTSHGLIIVLRAAELAQLDPKFIGRLFARHPSDLKPHR